MTQLKIFDDGAGAFKLLQTTGPVLDAQINYAIKDWKTIVKIGANNLLGNDYRTNIGAGFVGQLYYISLTFNEFMN